MSGRLGPVASRWLLAGTVLLVGYSTQAEQPFAIRATPTPSASATADPGSAGVSPRTQAASAATPQPTPTAPEATAGADQPTAPQPQEDPPQSGAPQAVPANVAPNALAYRIEIPRLGINLPVAEGDIPRDVDNAQTPEHYAFHLPGTSMFGAGNTYIYAHARPGMFLSLWNARVGDLVIVRTPMGTRQYVVAEIHPRVPPTQISWAGPTADTRLTLQTSTGPNGGDPRFVVVARPG